MSLELKEEFFISSNYEAKRHVLFFLSLLDFRPQESLKNRPCESTTDRLKFNPFKLKAMKNSSVSQIHLQKFRKK